MKGTTVSLGELAQALGGPPPHVDPDLVDIPTAPRRLVNVVF